MSKTKSAGSSKNNHKTAGKRLGVKLSGGQKVKKGQIIIRQVGLTKRGGVGTYVSRNFSIHASCDGYVQFQAKRYPSFKKQTVKRTMVSVRPAE